jgi:riboflavin biosynthesis pyrimidine reductase
LEAEQEQSTGHARVQGITTAWPWPTIVQQYLRAGRLDELVISLVPVMLGRGARPLDGLEPRSVQLDLVRVVDAPGVRHLTYRIMK